VNKLEEWLLAPPVYSLRRTHAYDELQFAETSRAEHTRDGYSMYDLCWAKCYCNRTLSKDFASSQASHHTNKKILNIITSRGTIMGPERFHLQGHTASDSMFTCRINEVIGLSGPNSLIFNG
jgi:hypothetical protein